MGFVNKAVCTFASLVFWLPTVWSAQAQTIELDAPGEVRVAAGNVVEIALKIKNAQNQRFEAADSLHYEAQGAPPRAAFDATRGSFSWVPDSAYENQTAVIRFRLLKNNVEIGSTTTRIYIQKEIYAPELRLPQSINAQPNRLFKYPLDYTDRAGRHVRILLTNPGPSGLHARVVRDTLLLNPALELKGKNQEVELRFDNGLRPVARTLQVLVEDVNTPPEFFFANNVLYVLEGQTKTLECTAIDREGDPLSYKIVNSSSLKMEAGINSRGTLTVHAPGSLAQDSLVQDILIEVRDLTNKPITTAVKAVMLRAISLTEQNRLANRYRAQVDTLNKLLSFLENLYKDYSTRVENRRRIKTYISIGLIPLGVATGFTGLIQDVNNRTVIAGLLAGASTVAAGSAALTNVDRADNDAQKLSSLTLDIFEFLTSQRVKNAAKLHASSLAAQFDDLQNEMRVFRYNHIYSLRLLVNNNRLLQRVAGKSKDPNIRWILEDDSNRLPFSREK